MSKPRCESCPVATGTECLGAIAPAEFGYFCEWASDGDPVRVRHIVGRSAIGLGPSLIPSLPPSEAGLASYRERQGLVTACYYRGEPLWNFPDRDGTRAEEPAGCGCTKTYHCGAGLGTFRSHPFEVTIDECLACVSARPA